MWVLRISVSSLVPGMIAVTDGQVTFLRLAVSVSRACGRVAGLRAQRGAGVAVDVERGQRLIAVVERQVVVVQRLAIEESTMNTTPAAPSPSNGASGTPRPGMIHVRL